MKTKVFIYAAAAGLAIALKWLAISILIGPGSGPAAVAAVGAAWAGATLIALKLDRRLGQA